MIGVDELDGRERGVSEKKKKRDDAESREPKEKLNTMI